MALLSSNSQIKIKLQSRIFLVVSLNWIMALDTKNASDDFYLFILSKNSQVNFFFIHLIKSPP